MNDNVYFEGDPSTDSARRHLERVLKSPEPARRWAWMLAALGSGSVWLLWHWGRAAARAKDSRRGGGDAQKITPAKGAR
jgi:hypothetical protein